MEQILNKVQKKAQLLIDAKDGNAAAISAGILPVAMQAFKTKSINTKQAEEMAAIMVALLSIWKNDEKKTTIADIR